MPHAGPLIDRPLLLGYPGHRVLDGVRFRAAFPAARFFSAPLAGLD